MKRKGKAKPSERLLRKISTGSTYRIDEESALVLAVYAKVGKHGAKKSILQESLQEWSAKNPLKPELWNAAMQLLEAEFEEK